MISEKGVSPDPEKISSIHGVEAPKNVRKLQQFLGMASYYRRFIKGFADIAAPLTNLLHKETKFEWSKECNDAFQTLKSALTSTPILRMPNFTKAFKLITDASNVGLGAVLTQEENGHEHVIAYASRALNSAERKYSATERECLAIVWGTATFRPYLLGQHFTIVTDHQPLTFIQSSRDSHGKLARWASKLSEFDFSIVYRKGSKNTNADMLSRLPEQNTASSNTVLLLESLSVDNLRELQQKDPMVQELLQKDDYEFLEEKGIVYQQVRQKDQWIKRIVIPEELRSEVLAACHDHPTAGHLGTNKTLDRVGTRFFWPGMSIDVRQWVKTCADCAS
jgi:hypothetical protein